MNATLDKSLLTLLEIMISIKILEKMSFARPNVSLEKDKIMLAFLLRIGPFVWLRNSL